MSGRSQPLRAGDRIGPYTCIRPLARGGMARLYLARRHRWARPVVCKVIRPEYADLDEFRSLFRREARVAARLRHPNIPRVHAFDVGGDGAGSPYMAMTWIDGPNLGELLRRVAAAGHTLDLGVAIAIVIDVARALQHAHGRRGPDGHGLGIVHRDVSPANILLARDGRALLTDFGVARTREVTRTTKASSLKGKAGYVAPEQFADGAVDARADVFSLGVVLYETTTGFRAFHDDNPYAQLNLVLTADYVDPTELCPGYPEPLARVVRAALQKDKAQRLGSARELAAALRAFARRHGVIAGRPDVARVIARYVPAPAPPTKPRWRWAPLGAALAMGAWLLARGSQDPTSAMTLELTEPPAPRVAGSGDPAIPHEPTTLPRTPDPALAIEPTLPPVAAPSP